MMLCQNRLKAKSPNANSRRRGFDGRVAWPVRGERASMGRVISRPLNQSERYFQFDPAVAEEQRPIARGCGKSGKRKTKMSTDELLIIRTETLSTPSDLGSDAVRDISGALNSLLADMFALYVKTKNFHWHVSGPHFRDFHLLLDEQADQIFATTDPIAERVRKIGGTTLRSIGQIAARKRLLDNDAQVVTPRDMLAELC